MSGREAEKTILDRLVASSKARVEEKKKKVSLEQVKAEALKLAEAEENYEFPFERALSAEDINFICEVKKASPSKGIIAKEFPYTDIAKEYEAAGAACVSVLTEPEYFLGSDEYFKEIRKAINIPMIRKDFTVDEYMIYEAKIMGADCVLLICSVLDDATLKKYLEICESIHLSALTETHDDEEIRRAVSCGARIIGVNNRNLKTFEVDIHNSERLRAMVPADILFVAESGIGTAEDINVLRKAGVNGVLIGETLMRSPDKKKMLDELRGNKLY